LGLYKKRYRGQAGSFSALFPGDIQSSQKDVMDEVEISGIHVKGKEFDFLDIFESLIDLFKVGLI
jgi:hypothetical protein